MEKKSWNNEAIEKLSWGLSGSSEITALHNRHKSVQGLSNDMHYSLELGIVLTGKMRRYYHGFQTDISHGDVWFCGMWEPHGYEILEAPCEVVIFIALPQNLITIDIDAPAKFNWLAPFTVPPGKRPQINRQNKKEIIAIAHKVRDILKSNKPQSQLWLRLLLLETLLTVQRNWDASVNNANASFETFARINPALQKIFEGQQCLSIADAAKTCNMGRSSFTKHFKTTMGISFAKFELRYRIKSAANQLTKSKDPVKKIAYDWDFTDSSHLHRCFLEHYGCTPTQYRKNLSKLTTTG